jgi:hypothetical protein
MKTSSSWNRRGSAVTSNGFFTVLKSSGWFPTFRLPDGFRYLTGKSVTNPSHSADVVARLTVSNSAANAPNPADSTIALHQIDTGQQDLHTLLRTGALALAAAALTFALLMWIMHPGRLL